MTNHALAALGQRHPIHDWEVADAAALAALTPAATDVGKIAWQQDDDSFWFLTDDTGPTWESLGSGGGGAVTSVNSLTGVVVLDPDDLDDTSTTNKFTDAADISKLAGIEALADVTDAANVASAGAVMEADTSTASMGFVIDEDDMVSNSATKVPTQQSTKAYVDAAVLASGSYDDEQAQDAIAAMFAAGTHTGITVTYDDGTNSMDLTASASGSKAAFQWTLDEGGVPAVNTKAWLVVPFDCTIDEHYLLADQTGDIVIDVWKDTYANFPPTVADTITAAAKPTLTGAVKANDTTLTGWTTTLTAGDIVCIKVDSAATLTLVTFSLIVTRT